MSNNIALDNSRAVTRFLQAAARGGVAKKKPGRKSKELKVQEALKQNTVKYFRHILDDESEAMLWRMFMTGKMEQLDDQGRVVVNSLGEPFYIDVELNPLSFQAFKLAVAYKRGMPTVTQQKEQEDGGITVNFNVMGGSADFYRELLQKGSEQKIVDLHKV